LLHHWYLLISVFQILQVSDIPYTLNGKRVEVLVKKVREGCVWTLGQTAESCKQLINGAPLSSVNPATLSNPECLQFYCDIGERLREESG
jgi:acetoacetyl-CoA synthetase